MVTVPSAEAAWTLLPVELSEELAATFSFSPGGTSTGKCENALALLYKTGNKALEMDLQKKDLILEG